jgi:hypothetical protein
MKPSKQVRRNLTKSASSRQPQRKPLGRILRVDPATLPAFMHQGKLATARPGGTFRLTVFAILTNDLAQYERGDLLQLDTEAPATKGNLVVAKLASCSEPLLGRLRTRGTLIHIKPLGGVQPDLGWFVKRSMFEFVHRVIGLLRIEPRAWA